jgi:3'(2'), 5'-bisphosphate nucleotidase
MLFNLNEKYKIEIDTLLDIAKQAGAGIMTVYDNPDADISISYKEDRSPLTLADGVSHRIITAKLAELSPGIPIMSEEGKDIPYEERKDWAYYWCVDPLDGTKEFIKRNGEFTVNIALINQNTPVLGVIYVPVTRMLYYGGKGIGSWKKSPDAAPRQLLAAKKNGECTAVASRTHSSDEEAAILTKYNVTKTISAGSSLKFCMVAEGIAQIYYRHGPTMEWDTAAGHAIAVYSGAKMTKPAGGTFEYNKPSLLNGSFLCCLAC